jgi:hypothetical protein
MAAKYQTAVTRLSIIIESNDIDALASDFPSVKCEVPSRNSTSESYRIAIAIAKEIEKTVTLNVFHLQMGKKNKRLHETLGVKPADGPLSYKELEDMRKHMKSYGSHHNAAEIEREFINAV